MAFSSTLTITVNAVAKVLNRINQDSYGSEYYLRTSTESWRARIRHSKEAPNAFGIVNDRHNFEVVHTIFGVSPAPDKVRTIYTIIRSPESDDATTLAQDVTGYVDYIDGASFAGDMLAWLN